LSDTLPRLSLRGISKRFPGVLANDNVSFEGKPGEIHALLGENGAGKSTLVKMIYGIMQPDAGEIYWNGRRVMVSNPNPRGRNPLCLSVSGDGMVFTRMARLPIPEQLEQLIAQVRQIAPVLGRTIPAIGPHPAANKVLAVPAAAQSATT